MTNTCIIGRKENTELENKFKEKISPRRQPRFVV